MCLKMPPRCTQSRLHHAGESGQALVETAVTLGLLLIMMIGAAEIGRIAYASIQVTNAAKAAVQYGAQGRTSATDTTGMKTAASLEAPSLSNLVTTVQPPYCFCANDIGTAVDCQSTTACQGTVLVESLTVQTSATFDPLFHVPGLPTTFNLQGQAVQQVLSSD